MASSSTAPRVMVLDDEAMVLSAISCFFDLETDFELVQFRCPVAALSYLREHRVDVVIADLALGPMEGEAFAEAARELHSNLPVIFLSGCVDEARCEALRGLAASWCLAKPWSNCELWSTVVTACQKGPGKEE